MSRQPFYQVVYATVVTDDFQQSAGHHGDDDEFPHADNALTHGLHPSEHVIRPLYHTDGTRQQNAQCQHRHHVHTENGHYQDDEIGEHFQQFDVVHVGWRRHTLSHEDVNHQYDYCGGNDDERVDAELVGELTALRLSGHDGGITDKREIVAEERATDDHCRHQCHRCVRLCRHACRDGCQCYDGAYARADAQRYKTGG